MRKCGESWFRKHLVQSAIVLLSVELHHGLLNGLLKSGIHLAAPNEDIRTEHEQQLQVPLEKASAVTHFRNRFLSLW